MTPHVMGAYGRGFLGHQAGVAILIDLAAVALFIAYLVGVRRNQNAARQHAATKVEESARH